VEASTAIVSEAVPADALSALNNEQGASAVKDQTPRLGQTAGDELGLPSLSHNWFRLGGHEHLRAALRGRRRHV
jgi:hypothetical protein